MARLHRTTQRDIWALSFWAQPPERSWPMGAATGGRHTVVEATTIPTRRRTVAPIGAMVIILTQRLTMITTPELTAGMGVLMDHTDRPRQGRVIIPTQERMHEAVRSRRPTAAEVPPKPITRTPGPMPRPGKVRVRTPNGAAPMCRGETRALPWGITRPPM